MKQSHTLRGCIVVAIAYVITAELACHLFLIHESTSIIWPPVGVSLAALLLVGPRLWPGVAVGALVSVLSRGHPLALAVWIAAVEVGEVLLGYWLLHSLAKMHNSLDRVRDVVALALTSFCISLGSAAASVTGLVLLERVPPAAFNELFATWWWGHLSANLVIAPMILTWGARLQHGELRARPRWIEIAVVAASVVLVNVVLFSEQAPSWLPATRAPYYLLPLLLWAGLRFGLRGAATASCATSLMAIASTALGGHPFDHLSDLQSFVSISSLTTLVLSAMAVERFRAVNRKAAIQHAALDAIVSVDSTSRIVEFNPAAERLFGYRAVDVLEHDAAMLVPLELKAAYDRGVRRLQSDSASLFVGQRYSTTIRRADNTEVPVEVAIANVTVDGEHVITGFLRDVTEELAVADARRHSREVLEQRVDERTQELTHANRELRRGEELLQQAEELAHLGSFELDVKSRRLRWSAELYRIHGREPATYEPSFEEFLDAIHPEDRGIVADAFQKAIQNEGTFGFEERIIRPNGEVRQLQTRGRVFHNGVVSRVAGCSQDVTQQKADEEARYRLVDIAASSEDAIIGLTTDGIIESWNGAAERIFGYAAAEVIGKPCPMLVEGPAVATMQRIIERTAAGEHVGHYEMRHCRKGGGCFDASVTTSPIRDREGHIIGLSKVLRDITKQKLAENQLKASLGEKEVLLREIHHRVKNNLQVISSLLNLQVAGETSDGARKGLIESQSRIQSMALVHQQLYQSKDLGRIDFTEYLRSLSRRLLETYLVGSDRIGITVTGPSLQLDIDQAMPCGLIVNELVANAIHHAFPDGRNGHILVTLERVEPDRLALTVADDGIGLPLALRIESTPTFGLQIARTLTHQLGGTIEVTRDEGTTLRIVFPIGAREALAA